MCGRAASAAGWRHNLWVLILIPQLRCRSFYSLFFSSLTAEYLMYGMPLWRLVMSEQEVPPAGDNLACNTPTWFTAERSALSGGRMGKSWFLGMNDHGGHSCKNVSLSHTAVCRLYCTSCTNTRQYAELDFPSNLLHQKLRAATPLHLIALKCYQEIGRQWGCKVKQLKTSLIDD